MHQLRSMHGNVFEQITAKIHAPEIIHKTQHASWLPAAKTKQKQGANQNLPHEADGGLKRNRNHHHRYICHVVSQILPY